MSDEVRLSSTERPAHHSREHRRRRFRRHRRIAYIRSLYSLPSLATLGNVVCGFGAMYVAALSPLSATSPDLVTRFLYEHHFTVAACLIFIAMFFDAIDGRLARFTRHTTDFGGQLDSLADVISFGAAPAFLALAVFKATYLESVPPSVSRLIWAVGALYVSCAALRLARFNVSNEHGEQHHYSFFGLPSPGAGGTVAAWVLMQQDLAQEAVAHHAESLGGYLARASDVCVAVLPVIVLATGLLMVSSIRYPHLVNRYLRGRRSLGRIVLVLAGLLVLVVWPKYAVAAGMLFYAFSGVVSWGMARMKAKGKPVGT